MRGGWRPAALSVAAVTAVLAIAGTAAAQPAGTADPELVPLVRDLQWPHVSGLIGYGDRLWFVNSRKFVSHNSADIYSYDPVTGTARYERRLFSQDAGEPAVVAGLLYWPFADSRWAVGRGEFMVTNGTDWRWGLMPEVEAFHVDAMTGHGGALYAALSGRKATIQRSGDHGASWKPVYAHPAPERRVSRIITLGSFNGSLYGGLRAGYEEMSPKLLRWHGNIFKPVAGWPEGQSVSGLVAFGGWLYGDNGRGERGESAVWRTDGRRVERVGGLDGARLRAMAAGAGALWAVTADRDGGFLLKSTDGVDWRRVQKFVRVRPVAVAVYAGRVYVGGSEKGGGGVLLGPPTPAPAGRPGPRRALPERAPPTDKDPADALARLEEVLGNALRYGELRAHVLPLARFRDPAVGHALARRLEGRFPYSEASMFGGVVKVSAAKMARWFIMWAMARNGHGHVPLHLIRWPWDVRQNRTEKYLEPAPGAAWAAAEIGQNDAETIATLIGRLDVPDDPDWLHGDMIGALTALTGQRFGYDRRAWLQWWETRSERTKAQ